MQAYREARCPQGHEFMWLTGTPFLCPVCKQAMRPGKDGKGQYLTEREKDVATLVGEGLTNREIAGELVIQESTVENHLHRIFAKLQLKTRTQLARYGWEQGIKRHL